MNSKQKGSHKWYEEIVCFLKNRIKNLIANIKQNIDPNNTLYWIGFVSGFGFYRRQISKRSTSGYTCRTFRALVGYSFDLLNWP